jgi:hypothetical protein
MSARFHAEFTLPAAFMLLPPVLDSPEARALVLAIGLQESDYRDRVQKPQQVGWRPGPARGFWQFERGGGACTGLLERERTRPLVERVCEVLRYDVDPQGLWEGAQHNDVLACALARLLLFSLPHRLPTRDQPELAWAQYLEAWKPGRAHPDKWPRCHWHAWSLVGGPVRVDARSTTH